MASNIKKVLSTSFFILGCLYSIIYFLGCLTAYINPAYFYGFTFLALLFPYLLVGMVTWLVIVFIFYRKRWWIFLLILLVGFQNISAVFSFHLKKEFDQQKDVKSIRVLSWNVMDFIDSQYHSDTVGNKRREMIHFIKQTNADIICIQDFTEQGSPAYRSSIKDMLATQNYPYYFFSIDFQSPLYNAYTQYGTAIFSKFPIVDSGSIAYDQKKYPESLAFADIKIANDTIRVHNTHLRSMYLKFIADTANKDLFISDEMDFLFNHPNVEDRLRHYDLHHVKQVAIAKPFMNNCKYPYIFCADLNSVPSSYVYQKISKGLTDAFTAKGSGFGATYDGIAPTLRIDVVLMSKQLKPVQYYSPQLHLSDHFPIVTDIQLH